MKPIAIEAAGEPGPTLSGHVVLPARSGDPYGSFESRSSTSDRAGSTGPPLRFILPETHANWTSHHSLLIGAAFVCCVESLQMQPRGFGKLPLSNCSAGAPWGTSRPAGPQRSVVGFHPLCCELPRPMPLICFDLIVHPELRSKFLLEIGQPRRAIWGPESAQMTKRAERNFGFRRRVMPPSRSKTISMR